MKLVQKFRAQRIVGRIQIQNDFFRLLPVSFEEDLNQLAVHGSVIQHDLLPTGRLFGQFQTVQGALSG